MANAVIAKEPSVPSLIQTPALTLTAEDVALPRIYIGQFMSKAVQDQLVKMGDIYSGTGSDDPDPQVLWNPKAKGENPGVLFHVLHIKKGKSYSDGGELQLFDYDDPNAPPEAWVTYNYSLACPEIDADMPFKMLLTRTGRPAALQINTVLAKQSIVGPSWINAFRLTTAERENKKGKYAVAQVRRVEANSDHIKTAESLYVMLSPQATEFSGTTTTGDEPAI